MLELLPTLFPLIGAAGGVIGSVKFVREGERALKLRFEKALTDRNGQYKVVTPGLKLIIPTVHKLARIHVRQRTINFPTQNIILNDMTVFGVGAVLLCKVKDTADDLYKALFETTGIDGALTDYGMVVIREVLSNRGHDDLFEKRVEITEELMQKLQRQADEWGVEVLKFELSDCEPSVDTARLIQTSVQTQFKVNALKEAAQTLGHERVSDLNPNIAAVLVGVPLVAGVNSHMPVRQDALPVNQDDMDSDED